MSEFPPAGFGRAEPSIDFAGKLSALVSREMAAAHGDSDRVGVVIERLAAALGFTIAMASRGDGKAIDTFVEGVTGYLHSEAVDKSKLAKFMASVGRRA